MSDKERPRDDEGGGDNDDGEGGDWPTKTGYQNEIKRKVCVKEGKRVSLFRLIKGKKLREETKQKKKKKKKKKKKGVSVNPGCLGRRGGDGGGCFCLSLRSSQPQITLDSSGESPTSDPNSSEFTLDMLRALIEKNDFYSKECSPHLDGDDYK